MNLKGRDIAAEIELRLHQLKAQGVEGDAVFERMMGFLPHLKELYASVSSRELQRLCTRYPLFKEFGELVEDALSEIQDHPLFDMIVEIASDELRARLVDIMGAHAEFELMLDAFFSNGPRSDIDEQLVAVGEAIENWRTDICSVREDLKPNEMLRDIDRDLDAMTKSLFAQLDRVRKNCGSGASVQQMRAPLTLNREFVQDFVSAPVPSVSLGLIEERKKRVGVLVLVGDRNIPNAVTGRGFRFGHALLSAGQTTLVQFSLEFYGFGVYHVLMKADDHVVRHVLPMIVDSRRLFFVAINPGGGAQVFGGEEIPESLSGLNENLPLILSAPASSHEEYQRGVSLFERNLDDDEWLAAWACQGNLSYLNLDSPELRFEMRPSR